MSRKERHRLMDGIRQLLRDHPKGVTGPRIRQLLGIPYATFKELIEDMGDVYIATWRTTPSIVPVYVVASVPDDAPRPVRYE